ncbi:hypothetical protein [Vibrio salinus]|uniref:hypothetical protein n=1 Tax=Vibrio salinus TaxID=2899784 RepID=UPI001E2D2E9A|nr:hypothetical protein [Vibrio salinus]MCE0493127.1 hypothetical protein [Vibrio salinus]
MNKEEKKYPFTKRLVNIAIENGYTNKDIANVSRISKNSIAQVSKWRHGESLAKETQMAHLIKEFGHLLKRQTEHLFYIFDEKSERELEHSPKFFMASGERLLSQTLVKNIFVNGRPSNISLFRIIILCMDNSFQLIVQVRRGLQKIQTNNQYHFRNISELAHSNIEDAMWIVIANYNKLSLGELLNQVDEFADKLEQKQLCPDIEPTEGINLKFNVRQRLLKNGYKPLDIKELPQISLT